MRKASNPNGKNGDDRRFAPLTEEQKAIVERHVPLAHHFAKLVSGKYRKAPRDVLLSGAFEGLVRAAQTWNPRLGEFSTYAWNWMRRDCGVAATTERPEAVVLRYHATKRFIDSGRRVVSADGLLHWLHRQTREPEIDAEAVRDSLRFLPPRHAEAVRLYYFEGLTYRDVGKAMGVCLERARQILNASLCRLREVLEKRRIETGFAA